MNAMEYEAGVIERTANTLAYWIETTPQERLDWTPTAEASSKSRSVRDQAEEVIKFNRGIAAVLRGESTDLNAPYEAPATQAGLVREIAASGKEFADAVRTLSPESLQKTHDFGFGAFPLGAWIEICQGNMMYHGGQVNYIQTLFGDTEFRFPGPDYNPLKDA